LSTKIYQKPYLCKNPNSGAMDQKNKKLIRKLERLQRQIERLRKAYLAQQGLETQEVSKKEDVPSGSAGEEISEKDQKLLEWAIRTGKENDIYKTVSKKLDTLIHSGEKTFDISVLQDIKESIEQLRGKNDNWEIFKQKFRAAHPDFFDKLLASHPDLTKTEQKFCAYLRIHMNSAQIASALNVSKEAIRKNRYRIRKKLGLKTSDSLEAYINQF